MLVWRANEEVFNLLNQVKEKNHHPRLQQASVAVCFNDSPPFRKDKFNWGSVSKFSPLAKLWQGAKFDFCITLSSDAWITVLDNPQREALLDLHLTRCSVQRIPETVVENGKKKVIKDEWGRVRYTEEIKLSEDGEPIWIVEKLDLEVMQENVKRYGCWLDCFSEFKDVLIKHE